jgi:hypothetical protein
MQAEFDALIANEPGAWYHALLASILLLESGFFGTNCTQMGLLIATRYVGSFEVSLSALV